MDSIFKEFLKLHEEIEGVFLGNIPESKSNVSPRAMMLKRDHESRPNSTIFEDHGDNLFKSKSLIKTFNRDANGQFKEEIVIRDSDGNEKIITNHSVDGRTTHKEIHRQGDKIISEKEIVSDIPDNLGQIDFGGHDANREFNENAQSKRNWAFWEWFY